MTEPLTTSMALSPSINRMRGVYVPPPAMPIRTQGAAAAEIPSRMNDRLHYRDGRVTDLAGNLVAATPASIAPLPAPAPAPAPSIAPAASPVVPPSAHCWKRRDLDAMPRRAPRPASPSTRVAMPTYTPREGSLSHHVITALQALPPADAYLTIQAICDRFDTPRSQWQARLKSALDTGGLKRVTVDGHVAVALPSYEAREPQAARAPGAQPAVLTEVHFATLIEKLARIEKVLETLTAPAQKMEVVHA